MAYVCKHNIKDAKEYTATLNAGRNLDYVINYHVYGVEPTSKRASSAPNFSTNEHDAFMVVRAITLDGVNQETPLHFKLVYAWWPERAFPQVQARASFDWQLTGSDGEAIYQAEADTVPLAICRAALQVMLADTVQRAADARRFA